MTSKTTTAAPATTFADLDPTTLVIEANVRADAALTPGFVASIRENGVLMPILVQHTDGTYLVRAGQRRTLAAIEAGLSTIPARVVAGDDDQTRRIIEQIIENDERTALTDTDRAAAFQQLALMGVSAATIAKRTGRDRAIVEAGITVAGSGAALAAIDEHDLDLLDAAIFAEFEDDLDAIETLTRQAGRGWGSLAHTAQQIRDKRAEDAAVAAITEALTAQGVTVRRAPGYYENEVKALDSLRAKGSRAPLTPADHAACPGHAAYVDTDGEPVAVYVCTDYKTHGHQRIAQAKAGQDGAAATGWTEEQKAERRTLVANNKAWKSAEAVRREWLASFAARKTAPKDAPAFIASALAESMHSLHKAATDGGHRLARTLLGLPEYRTWGQPDPLTEAIAKASPARAGHIALVIVLAAIEDSTGTHTWRHQSREDRDYFAALARWGYHASEVEALVTATDPAAADVDQVDEPDGDEAA